MASKSCAFKKIIGSFGLVSVLAACAPGSHSSTEQIVNDVQSGASCANFSESLTATLSNSLINQNGLPSTKEVESSLKASLSANPKGDQVASDVADLYQLLSEETRQKLNINSDQEMLEAMTALEIGDRTTPEKVELREKLDAAYSRVNESAKAAGLACATPVVPSAPTDMEAEAISDSATSNLPVRGALRVLATAYQSCQAPRLAAMTRSTASIGSGAVTIVGTHSDGIGKKRVVSNAAQLMATNYYTKGGVETGSSCFNIKSNPLIYDYGGKPFATATSTSTLNLFKNSGSGTAALGIDCSGYVFSSMAVSGLRLSPGKKLTAAQVYGVSARMFMDPANNGLKCFAPVPSKKDDSLRPGDILASKGHIVMVASVGSDPFGIAKTMSMSDCSAARLSFRNFDFEIMQSSPIKGGIGINRIQMADYLEDNGADMKAGLIDYAVAACKAKFGAPGTVKPTTARLVRHSLTADCKDTAVPLEKESCVSSCLAGI